jgi:(E)-4-hydroxy-3-methylbut-2-enyl-diphosphate synthase
MPWKMNVNGRIPTREVAIGDVPVGGSNPIRVQSMTTADTMNTDAVVAEAVRMIEAGCEYVRITAPSKNEAENLAVIKRKLRERGYRTPLVADIHFTPNAAEIAARIVEKVRINPGNYADKKKFELKEYSDSQYQAELERIYKRFAPLVKVCKEYGTAMRIGVNHGSLSDRIMSRYGDTPEGMVQSALEFIDVCEDLSYYSIVVSMKASNPQTMVQAYRLLVEKMRARGTIYPLHLGVTEAGDGEDGRVKSALGIGALLADGIGDTVRVSLTEPPENEIPVARYLIRLFPPPHPRPSEIELPYHPFSFSRRVTSAVLNVGGENVPRVVADFSLHPPTPQDLASIGHRYHPLLDKWEMDEQGADYLYLGSRPLGFMPPNGLKEIYDYSLWRTLPERRRAYPYFSSYAEFKAADVVGDQANWVQWEGEPLDFDPPGTIWVVDANDLHRLRRLVHALDGRPVILKVRVHAPEDPTQADDARYVTAVAAALSEPTVDGLYDGLWIATDDHPPAWRNRAAFAVLQAGRLRTTKTEYISCPSCGRTLFDLQETTAMIRRRTEHLKGVKIGIMGCIVNGPGEMADADYGYVGSGPDVITLYKGKDVVARAVPTERAVDELIELIRADGRWVEPAK